MLPRLKRTIEEEESKSMTFFYNLIVFVKFFSEEIVMISAQNDVVIDLHCTTITRDSKYRDP